VMDETLGTQAAASVMEALRFQITSTFDCMFACTATRQQSQHAVADSPCQCWQNRVFNSGF
jgi:hypothetical protein